MDSQSQALDRPRKKAEQIGVHASPHAASADDAALNLEDLWSTIRRNKWLILLICVSVTGAAAGITWVLPKVYEAKSIVAVEESPTAQATMAGYAPFTDLSGEIGILESSGELSRRVVATARAHADSLKGEPFSLFAPSDEGTPPDEQTISERLQEMMDFEADDEKGLIEITAQSENPEESAVLANVFANEYRQFSQEMARSGVSAARQFLQGQLEKRKDDIEEVESEWEQFARTNEVATDGETGQNVAREYAELQTERDALVFQLEQEERTLSLLKDQLETIQPNLRSKVLEEQNVQSLRTQIQALEEQIADLKTLSEQYYINDPSLRGNESRVSELADIKRRIDGFTSRKDDLTEELVSATESSNNLPGDGTASIGMMGEQRTRIQEQEMTVGQLKAQIQGLNNRIENYQGRIASLPRQTVEREQLNRRLEQAEQFYKEIASELQQTVVAEESELGYVTVMRAAVTPLLPVSPNMNVNVILGLLLGLGLGIGVAFVRQSMDWQIYEPEDIRAQGYSLVGVIPTMDHEMKKLFNGEEEVEVEGKMMSTRLLPLLNPWSPITENYRLVRANLQYAAQNGNGNGTQKQSQTLMVTSAEPGDGKTTTAANMAITMALSGRSVLLIDADMRRSTAHELFGVNRSPGLADVLVDARADDIVQKTVVDGLFFLPAGNPQVPPTELLDSERMRTLLAQASDRFDVVIIDTPPVLAASDPIVVAPLCDSTLVVAAADNTDFRALDQVKETLSAVGVSVGGVIFNRYDVTKASGSYKYGYDYEYDYTPDTEVLT
ncbi:MAG: polysaccharide biosynthesis tyrosine autokinase [Salinibacter sp.]